MVIIIDNYDSFVYNLFRYVMVLGHTAEIYRNDQITIADIQAKQPSHIILSPGPCAPDDAGICLELILAMAPTTPLLGVCLGHQAIAQAFGGNIIHAPTPMHGMASDIIHHQQGIFHKLPNPLRAARYHSLTVDPQQIPSTLTVTAHTDDHHIMALQHQQYPCFGVQFHPESVLTPNGLSLLKNFLSSRPPTAPGINLIKKTYIIQYNQGSTKYI